MSLLTISYPELEPDDFEWIQRLRADYCEHDFKIVDPHFTLVFPVSEIDTQAFSDHVRPIVSSTTPIDLVIRCSTIVKTVGDERWYLFLTPDEGFSRIVKLHDSIYTGIMKDHLRLDIPYIPHITIGIFDNARDCKTANDRLNSEDFAITSSIAAVDIVSYDNDTIETIVALPFG